MRGFFPLLFVAVFAVQGQEHGGISLVQLSVRPAEDEGDADWHAPDLVFESQGPRVLPFPFFKAGDARPHKPQKHYKDAEVANESSIVVLIAALRESRVVHTLESMFENANNPKRVFVGLVQQNTNSDQDTVEKLCEKLGTPLVLTDEYAKIADHHRRQPGEDDWGQKRFTPESLAACAPASRVRTYRMGQHEAAGPVFARAQQRRLLQKGADMEDFVLQIDAHTIFTKGWDSLFLREFAATDNDYAVLTTYPTNADEIKDDMLPPNINNHWEMPHLCSASLAGGGVVRNSIAGAAANLRAPILAKFWGAGLSFSRCHAERDVPSDPGLKQIFTGEEFSRAARLWTNGYDFYTMSRAAIGTYYGNEKGGIESWDPNYEESEASSERLRQLLCQAHEGKASDMRLGLKGYDLGSRRTLEDYIQLTGIDTINEEAHDTPCRVMTWTPWRKDGDVPYEPLRGAPAEI